MNWIYIAIISIVAISVANIFQRVAMKDEHSNPLVASVFFLLTIGALSGVYAILTREYNAPPVGEYAINFIISTVFYAAGTYAYFKAAKGLEASTLIILSAMGGLVSIVAAGIFLQETITSKQLFGTVLIFLAILIVSNKAKGDKAAFYWGLSGASLYGLAVINDTFIIQSYNPAAYTSIMSFLPAILLLLLNSKLVPQFRTLFKWQYLKNILIYSFFYAIQAISYYSALLSGAMASQMAAIFKAEIILTILLSVIFLKETDRLRNKILSGILVTIGILLVK